MKITSATTRRTALLERMDAAEELEAAIRAGRTTITEFCRATGLSKMSVFWWRYGANSPSADSAAKIRRFLKSLA